VILSPGTSISLRYVGWRFVDSVISGILAVLQKKTIFGSFANVNLNPTGDRKFLLSI
jgi:hypothetical protein